MNQSWPNTRYCLDNYLKVLKVTKILRQDIRCPDRNSNSGLPGYEAGLLSVTLYISSDIAAVPRICQLL
jgi:hypothetical protein